MNTRSIGVGVLVVAAALVGLIAVVLRRSEAPPVVVQPTDSNGVAAHVGDLELSAPSQVMETATPETTTEPIAAGTVSSVRINGVDYAVEWMGPTRLLRYPNGQLYSRALFSGEKQDGLDEAWYSSGVLSNVGGWVAGLREGEWRAFHEDGSPMSVGEYRSGRRSGTWTVWYPDGRLRSRGSYQDGERVGPWEFWQPNGDLDASISGQYVGNRKVKD